MMIKRVVHDLGDALLVCEASEEGEPMITLVDYTSDPTQTFIMGGEDAIDRLRKALEMLQRQVAIGGPDEEVG